MSARGRVPRGGVSGRTHRSAPTRWGRRSEPTENWREDGPCQRGEREWTDGGVWSPRPTEVTQVVRGNGPMWASALTKGEQAASTTRASGAQRSGRERWVEIAAEITPKGASNAGQSLSQPAADSSLYTREPLGTGDADCRVGPAGLLAMTSVFCHSEERSDVGIRPFYDGRWTMYGGSGRRVVGPYGWLQRAAATTRAAL